MADVRTNIQSIDPVWEQIQDEARQAVLGRTLGWWFCSRLYLASQVA